eukprot:CAMPEP_0184554264 /NCGR_PEP_ID=MMETSP0199_2-20130426/34463_1 /TAXON_ID=1112570 /ORGANISM="Thraustochytrium sp., Strain LLF1b" /LENGTH=159 /DNA_ID=CAMNT_0026950237 /DNA_START=75 /DNA_END=550 /DNA_ORIENTATION=-
MTWPPRALMVCLLVASCIRLVLFKLGGLREAPELVTPFSSAERLLDDVFLQDTGIAGPSTLPVLLVKGLGYVIERNNEKQQNLALVMVLVDAGIALLIFSTGRLLNSGRGEEDDLAERLTVTATKVNPQTGLNQDKCKDFVNEFPVLSFNGVRAWMDPS